MFFNCKWAFISAFITYKIKNLTLPPQEGYIRLESDMGLSKESLVTWTLSPLGKNVDYRMDTFSLDKNVSIRGVRREKYPESKLRMWSHLSRGSAVKNCTVYPGTAVGVIMMQQDSTACERIKQRGTKLHKNHNFLGFWQRRPLTQISTLSNYMTPYYLHFNYQLLKRVTDSKWRGLSVREYWTQADIFF